MKRRTHQLLAIFTLAILISTSSCQRDRATSTQTLLSPTLTPTPTQQLPGKTPTVRQLQPTSTAPIPSSQINLISSGGAHTCMLMASGGVRCWGDNRYGQLGDGTKIPTSVPVEVKGLGEKVVSVEAGGNQTCALTASGGVKCWGLNASGELGDGTREDSLTPVDVIGLGSGVVSVSITGSRACALTAAGSVKCWGLNWYGQENGETNFSSTPTELPSLSSEVSAIAVGYNHSCALMTKGGVKCWGFNSLGQLGDGSTKEGSAVPVDVVGLDSRITAISLGTNHACVLTDSGGVKCWGDNNWGQLGDGTRQASNIPVDVAGLSSGVLAVSAGSGQSCTLMASGEVKCWGFNRSGNLGDGTTENRLTPVNVIGLDSKVVAISPGGDHTCALEASGGVKCWGENQLGQLGDGVPPIRMTPADVIGLSSEVSLISVGNGDACALTFAGILTCWGFHFLSTDGTSEFSVPMSLANMGGEVRALTVGSDPSICILTNFGGVKCGNRDGTLVDVPGLESGVKAISAGAYHRCALTDTGGVKCWGQTQYGGLGDGTSNPSVTPVDVTGLGSGVAELALGFSHTCVRMVSGGVKCWGWNGFGQLGDGTETDRLSPVDVVGLDDEVRAITAGGYHTCVLTMAGGVKCWGQNYEGQLGDGAPTLKPVVTPVEVVGLSHGMIAITAGDSHTCALTDSGEVKCWGDNYTGQLGDGSLTDGSTPVDVFLRGGEAAAIDAGQNYNCLLTNSGGVKCWGDNYAGQIGDGRALWSAIPIDVAGLQNQPTQ
jgi:alpha-tubulin suppressor-like RCC1 family protein